MVIEQLELLCIRDEKKISNVLKDIGVSPSNAQRWRNGERMNTETLIKLADYFNVSTDYILGREKDTGITDNSINRNGDNMSGGSKIINNNDLQPLEQELINEFRKYSKIEQLEILRELEQRKNRLD